jgi:hypothetical protein
MATIAAEVIPSPEGSHKVFIVTWANMQNGDVGEAVALSQYSDRSVQVSGTLAGASVTIEGSLESSITNFATLTDTKENDLLITTAKIETIMQLVRWLRPVISGGGGATVTVRMLCRLT